MVWILIHIDFLFSFRSWIRIRIKKIQKILIPNTAEQSTKICLGFAWCQNVAIVVAFVLRYGIVIQYKQ